ncbi:MAG TPA: antibiotic biosynthesis monooxygenase [Pseudonocardia sp.]
MDGAGDGRIGRYVRMVAVPGKGSVLAGALLRVAEGLRDTPGCELYVVNLTADEPDVVWVTEVWSDADASDRALSGDLGEVGIGEVVGLLAGPPELVELTPLGGPGLPAS